MPYYEHVFIARQDISPAQVETLTEDLTQIVKENGGTVANQEYWGLRTLQYKIRKNRKGHYGLLKLDAPALAIQELERRERIHEDILRAMTIKVDELTDDASPIMSRRDRDDRGGRGGDRDRR